MAGVMKSFSKGLATVNVKTNVFMEENKCKTYISTLEEDIRKLKLEIGENTYRLWTAGNFELTAVESLLGQIQEKEREIEQQRQKIQQLHVEEERILGSHQNQAAPVDAGEPRIYCTQCGAPNKPDYKFCVKCGQPL